MSENSASARDQRRRRILENSESRLNRIRGINDQSSPSKRADANKDQSRHSQVPTKNFDVNSEWLDCESDQSEEPVHQINESSSFPRDVSESEIRGSRTNSSFSRRHVQKHSIFEVIIKRRRSAFILLALMYRLLLHLAPSFLPSLSIMFPFGVCQCCLYLMRKTDPLDKRSGSLGLIGPLFMLCGIPMQTVSTLASFITHYSAAFEDFCIYFFTFAVFHNVLDVWLLL